MGEQNSSIEKHLRHILFHWGDTSGMIFVHGVMGGKNMWEKICGGGVNQRIFFLCEIKSSLNEVCWVRGPRGSP